VFSLAAPSVIFYSDFFTDTKCAGGIALGGRGGSQPMDLAKNLTSEKL
jgi:hypothetical protein